MDARANALKSYRDLRFCGDSGVGTDTRDPSVELRLRMARYVVRACRALSHRRRGRPNEPWSALSQNHLFLGD